MWSCLIKIKFKKCFFALKYSSKYVEYIAIIFSAHLSFCQSAVETFFVKAPAFWGFRDTPLAAAQFLIT